MTGSTTPQVMFDCPAGTISSAELRALHLSLQLHDSTQLQVVPRLAASPWVRFCSDAEITRLREFMQQGAVALDRLTRTPESIRLPATLVRTLGDELRALPNPLDRDFVRSIGFASLTDTAIDRATVERGKRESSLLVASPWQAELLQSAGLHNIRQFATGLDSRRFHPGARRNLFAGRFVIYSAGRLDYRKGQDLVIDAVRAFRRRHPDTLLLCAWQHPLPEQLSAFRGTAPRNGLPAYVGGQLHIAPWLAHLGVPTDSVVDVGLVSNGLLPDIVREAHVGLFPNRAEATPSTAMLECMASGVPCIVADNTAHKEYAKPEFSYPLTSLTPVDPDDAGVRGTDDWGSARVDEIVEVLEQVYTNTADARRRGVAAARHVAPLGWHKRATAFAELITQVVPGKVAA